MQLCIVTSQLLAMNVIRSLIQGSHRHWKTWKTWKNETTFFQSGKSQGILKKY